MQLGHDDVVKEIRKSLSVKSNGLHLRLAQPGLEHVMEYRFESNESQQLLCYEHMFEALCTFSVPAQVSMSVSLCVRSVHMNVCIWCVYSMYM